MLIDYKLIFVYKFTLSIHFILIFFEEIFLIILINETKNIISLFIFIFLKFIPTLIFPLKEKNVKFEYNIIIIIFNFINIFFSLIFMEIVILKFCKYNENVNNEISKRAQKEVLEINEILND